MRLRLVRKTSLILTVYVIINLIFPVHLLSNINNESNASVLNTNYENNSHKQEQLKDYLTQEYIQLDENPSVSSKPISSVPKAGKRVAITFDDGPHGYWTNKYIEILETHQIKATFFLLGSKIELFPDAVENLVNKGFEIGSHSYSHILMKNKKSELIETEFVKNVEILTNITGAKVKLFRPPYGAYDDKVIHTAAKFQQQTVIWNIDPRDWEGREPDTISQKVLENVSDGSIILLHEGKKNTIKALPQIIEGLKLKGYKIVTVSELLRYNRE